MEQGNGEEKKPFKVSDLNRKQRRRLDKLLRQKAKKNRGTPPVYERNDHGKSAKNAVSLSPDSNPEEEKASETSD